jgi:hypothetical protein
MKRILSKWLKTNKRKQADEEVFESYTIRKPCRYWKLEEHLENIEKSQFDS